MSHSNDLPSCLVGAKGLQRFLKCKSYNYNDIEKDYHVKRRRKLSPLNKKKSNKTGRQIHTRFKKDYLEGLLPFEIDYSAHAVIIKGLAWKQPIQELNLKELFPTVIDGLSDSDIRFAKLADLVISDLMIHATRYQIYTSLPSIIQTFKKAFRSKKKGNCMSALKTLRTIVTSMHLAGSILSVRYEELLKPLNRKVNRLRCATDKAFYGQWKNEKLEDFIISTLNILEHHTDDLVDQVNVYNKIKAAIPSYDSIESAKLSTNLTRMTIPTFQNQTGDENISRQRKAGKYCLKKTVRRETKEKLIDRLVQGLNKTEITTDGDKEDGQKGLKSHYEAPKVRPLIAYQSKKRKKDKYSLLHLSRWPRCEPTRTYKTYYRDKERNIRSCPNMMTVKPLSKTPSRGPLYDIRLVDIQCL